jgi:hypothetical protein
MKERQRRKIPNRKLATEWKWQRRRIPYRNQATE